MEEVLVLSEVVEKRETRYSDKLNQCLKNRKKVGTKSCDCQKTIFRDIKQLNDSFQSLLRSRKRLFDAKRKVTDEIIKGSKSKDIEEVKDILQTPQSANTIKQKE